MVVLCTSPMLSIPQFGLFGLQSVTCDATQLCCRTAFRLIGLTALLVHAGLILGMRYMYVGAGGDGGRGGGC